MKIAFYNCKSYDREFFDRENNDLNHAINYFEAHLNIQSAEMITNEKVVCCFINDDLSSSVIHKLKEKGIKLIALRSAGFNHVDLNAAKECEIGVVRVPAYSPHAVAEHAVGLLLSLNRHLHRAYNRVREGDFSINGLMGYDLKNKTVGVIGTGKIGSVFLQIMHGFGCELLAHDLVKNKECEALGVNYLSLDELIEKSDIISLHCPLAPLTNHLINEEKLTKMKDGVIILNTSRGPILDTRAIINALKSGKIAQLGLDVYEEEEEHIFFEDLSESIIQDDVFARLLTFPNVLITSHQAFFTKDAVSVIAKTTLSNISVFEEKNLLQNQEN